MPNKIQPFYIFVLALFEKTMIISKNEQFWFFIVSLF